MRVRYQAYTWQGKRVSGIVEVESEEAAYRALKEEQLVPAHLREVRPRRSLVQLVPWLFRPRNQVIIDFTRQLATLLRSGIPLQRGLTAQRQGTRDLGLREALRQVMGDIQGGQRFSAACARHPTVFPDFYVRLLRVAEATGELRLILAQIAQLLERRKTLKDRVRRALVYPAIALLVAIIAGFVLVTYSLPALLGLISEFGGELPFATRLLMQGAQFLQSYSSQTFGGLVLVGVLLSLYTRTPRGRAVWDRAALRLPAVGRVVILGNMFSLMSTLGTLLRGGVSTVDSVRLAGQEVGNSVVRQGLTQVAEHISGGASLSNAFERAEALPGLVAQGVRSGEMGGNLVDVVEGLTEYYEKELDLAVSTTVELIQPVVILVVAAIVGFVATAVLSGIYSTLGSIA